MNAPDDALAALLTDLDAKNSAGDIAAIVRHTRVFWKQPWSVLLAAHAMQLGFLLWIAAHATFCCDAAQYYIPAGYSIFHDGLLWQDPYAGYRFYFVPLIFGLLEQILDVFATTALIPTLLPFALAATFFITSIFASLHILRREGLRRWFLFAIPLLFNPFVLAVVPYPLQESVVFIFCMPLLLLLLAGTARDFRTTCIIAASFAGFAFIARSSLLWVALPALLFILHKALCLRPSKAYLLQGAALVIAISATLIAPQSYISWQKFDTLNPLARTVVMRDQFASGVEMLNYATTFDQTRFGPFPIWSPYRDLQSSEKNSGFYFNHPAEGLFLALTHAWSGLHYNSAAPYVPRTALTIFNWWLLLSATIVAYGLLGILQLFTQPRERGTALFLATLAVLSCAYTAFVATESRFGLMGFVALSVAAWQLLMNRNERGLCLRALPLVIAYVSLCVVINALLLYRTSVPWPAAPIHAPTGTTDLPTELYRDVAAIYFRPALACPQFSSRVLFADKTTHYTFSITAFIRGNNATDRA